MKCKITWLYRKENEAGECIADDIVGSINEMQVGTWAQARNWIEAEIPKREKRGPKRRSPYRDHYRLELDAIELEEIGKFWDEDGEPQETRRIALYEHGPRESSWAEAVA